MKRITKRMLSVLLVMTMIVCMIPVVNHAKEARTLKDNLYTTIMELEKTLAIGAKDNLEIELKDDNLEDYEYQWEYRSFDAQDQNVWIELIEKGDQASYRLEDFSLDNVGEYRCNITSKTKQEEESVVFVRSIDAKLSWSYEEFYYYRQPLQTISLKLNNLSYGSDYTVAFQWYHEGELISGATKATLSVTLNKKGDYGTYTCQVRLKKEGRTYHVASQDMRISSEIYIDCDYNRYNYANEGKDVTLSVQVNDVYPSGMDVIYQWNKYDKTKDKYVEISGAKSSIYLLSAVKESDYGEYQCVISVSKNAQEFYSESKTLYLKHKMSIESIEDERYASPFEMITLWTETSKDIETDYRVTYQWYQGSIEEKNKLSGATGTSLSVETDAPEKFTTYYCEAKFYDKVTNVYLGTASCNTKVNYSYYFRISEENTENEPKTVIIKDSKALLESPEVYYDDEDYTLSYQWYKFSSGSYQIISGATTQTNLVNNLQSSNIGDKYYVKISLNQRGQVWGSKNIYYELVKDIGLQVDEGYKIKFMEGEVISSVEAGITCDSQYEDKLSYQWQGYSYDSEEDEFQNIKNATSKSFTPTSSQIKRYNYFRCAVKIDVPGYRTVYTSLVAYFNVDEVVDLTKGAYQDKFNKSSTGIYYTRKFIVSNDKKAISFSFKKNMYRSYIFVGSNGNAIDIYSDETESIMIEGNVVYVINYTWGEYTDGGFSKVEEKDNFEKSVYSLSMERSPNKQTYKYGEMIELDGIEATRHYNDGTYEKVKFSEWTSNTLDTKQMGIGEQYVTLKDSMSGKEIKFWIEVKSPINIEVNGGTQKLFVSGESKKISVKASNEYNQEKINYLWVMEDEKGKLVEIEGDDTQSEVQISKQLKTGKYSLRCYAYLESMGFNEEQYVSVSIRVVDASEFKLSNVYPESPHESNQSKSFGYAYRIPNAKKLEVTFDSRTELDYGDELYILDNKGKCSVYNRWDELSGKTIEVEGDTVKIYVAFGEFAETWGFAVTNIRGVDVVSSITKPKPQSTATPAAPKKITVPKAVVSSIKSKKKKLTIKIKKIAGAKGYQIVYATDRKLKKGKRTITTKKLVTTIKKLKSKKTFFIKVRAYKLDNKGKRVYGAYSVVKSKKVK